MKQQILMLCVGNHCRSPLAHTLLANMIREQQLTARFSVTSAGLGDWHEGQLANAETRANARTHGVEITHRSRVFTESAADEATFVFSMDRSIHAEALASMPARVHAKFHLFRKFESNAESIDVPDPYYVNNFEQIYQIIERNCLLILAQLVAGKLEA